MITMFAEAISCTGTSPAVAAECGDHHIQAHPRRPAIQVLLELLELCLQNLAPPIYGVLPVTGIAGSSHGVAKTGIHDKGCSIPPVDAALQNTQQD